MDIYDISIPIFTKHLRSLKTQLNKAAAFAEQKKFDVNTLFQARLAPDMFPLGRQIQIASDNAKGFVARLTDVKVPALQDNEQTIGEYLARIDRTLEILSTVKREDFKNYESKKIAFPWRPGVYLNGKDYVAQYAMPNFFFHVTTAYDIIRHNGVEIGKNDFLGEVNWQRG